MSTQNRASVRTPRRTSHVCPKAGCERLVPRERLACPSHWALVSWPTQREVYAAWRSRDVDRHAAAMTAAIAEMNRMSAQNRTSVTVFDLGYDGEITADPADQIELDGQPEPVITWRIPFGHAESLANALEAIDAAREALAAHGDAAFPYHDEEVQGIRDALMVLERAEVIFRTEDGFYAQVRTCRGCGCTDTRACEPPCSWSRPDVCSRCAA